MQAVIKSAISIAHNTPSITAQILVITNGAKIATASIGVKLINVDYST